MRILELDEFKAKEFASLKSKVEKLEDTLGGKNKWITILGLLFVVQVAVDILILLK